ncbi:Z1 domain-containing protein [Pseudoduganella sp. OTU4001]|uniref:Z1 domain-containing protein n=1 Tax=Pseudoduganella sp. OTU4001 TaxID=3043854 RepID=UPI00313D26BA
MTKATITVLEKAIPPLRWFPVAGEFTEEFLRRKSGDANGPSYKDLSEGEQCVLVEAQRILGRCLPPTETEGRETGLVVGYVQSGKTLSFETVMSLARDNNYGVVIVLAGTKTNLKEQSEKRLKKDLGIDEGAVWYHVSNPNTSQVPNIVNRLETWQRSPKKRRAVLITVLKQKDHLENLHLTLCQLMLDRIPVLIIDDEGDQASLNTYSSKNSTKSELTKEERSTIYNWIRAVRDSLPHHSYLQYTATPQANLLLARTDLLDPNFAELVTPGGAYTGGKAFFTNSELIEIISPDEVPTKHNPISTAQKSLLSALRYFLLSASQHALTHVRGKDINRSMMVHPSQATTSHQQYKIWMDQSLRAHREFVERNSKSDMGVIIHRFKKEYESLKKTFPDIKPLPELIEAMVEDVFTELNCVQVNSTADAEKNIDWKQTAYWILVGGNKLDRGYTVEGLCCTYMPRPLGSSPAADTLQQRARFFGYKSSYLGLCRVFIQQNVHQAFVDYVEHEEFVRKGLEDMRGRPLKEWRRDFLLNKILKPTRPNVVGLRVKRIDFDKWMVPGALHRDEGAVVANRYLLEEVYNSWCTKYGAPINASSHDRFKQSRGASSNFIIEAVPLSAVLEDFLLRIEVKDPIDAEEHGAMLVGIAEQLSKKPELVTDVYLMNNLAPNYRKRDAGRGWADGHPNAPINQYFSQSAGSLNDSHFYSADRITLHLRRFDLGAVIRGGNKEADMHNITWFALNVPKTLSKGTVIERR